MSNLRDLRPAFSRVQRALRARNDVPAIKLGTTVRSYYQPFSVGLTTRLDYRSATVNVDLRDVRCPNLTFVSSGDLAKLLAISDSKISWITGSLLGFLPTRVGGALLFPLLGAVALLYLQTLHDLELPRDELETARRLLRGLVGDRLPYGRWCYFEGASFPVE